MNPQELLYAKTHEWVYLAEEGGTQVATVGISAFAVEALTDLVYLDLPEVGRTVTAGESFGEIESVKAVSDLYSPLTGEIVAVNEELREALEKLGEDPYDAGWIVKIKVSDQTGLDQLMDHAAYEKLCEEEQA
ncbi:MAG: glycine cleavage system protein GcvH [Planctomycetales bacterium]|nr:glycine cleavage system protein GcvH [Planctomycetales bacterium]NIM08496.1 glycine cleavage system protein GcvH [Planctomycetales bacterium]NIN07973.1 glycine cleavage system protein GcvH [Planctomycetales bacterium]NIN77102.1 glycine cleavage system protein GcvH [Planctomycetales bacterium]NIO34282.1 glycine cleavage system protein GcvH [Planctomycetales bacterium]